MQHGNFMLYFTGSKENSIKLPTIARERGLKINEYGIFEVATWKRLAGATEEEMYKQLKFKYIPLELRLNNGEIEKAVIK